MLQAIYQFLYARPSCFTVHSITVSLHVCNQSKGTSDMFELRHSSLQWHYITYTLYRTQLCTPHIYVLHMTMYVHEHSIAP